jgi:hypothetical protein
MPQFTISALLHPSLSKSSVGIVVLGLLDRVESPNRAGVVEGPVGYAVAVGLEVMGEPLHAVQECEHFLAVVGGVAEFFCRFKECVDDVFARAVKPGMLGIELVSQN